MAFTDPKELGQLIFDANPYLKPPAAGGRKTKLEFMLDEVEMDYRGYQWTFKSGNDYVAKALRIPYCYTDADGVEVRDYLLIGYEGGGAV